MPADDALADSVVSANTGAARYSIPIEVPPGPGGFAPRLALTYSSRVGDGPFGVGWSLNLGEIRCSARFGVPDYSDCPRYELDGQLLVGGAGGVYHTFVESFRKIEHGVGPTCTAGWTVTSPDGIVSRYGCTPDSRILAPSGDVARWLLSELEDPFENRIVVTYDADPDAEPNADTDLGVTYPAEISYADGDRAIRFVYEARPDPLHDFAGGIERETSHRATAIEIESYGNVFRRHILGYDLADIGQAPAAASYSTQRSRLAWARLEGKKPDDMWAALPAQVFRYRDPSDVLGTGAIAQWLDGSSYNVDLVPDNPFLMVPPQPPTHVFGDVNGDGLVDRIEGAQFGDFTLASIDVYLNDGSGFVRDQAWSDAFAAISYPHPRMDLTQVRLEDPYSGAILPAVCAAEPAESDGPIDTMYFRSPLDNASKYNGYPIGAAIGETFNSFIEATGRPFLVDVDADGLADVVVSVRLSGVHLNAKADCTAELLPKPWNYVEGTTASYVFRNTGSGWVRDDALAQGLPAFGEVAFESVQYVEAQHPTEDFDYWENANGACLARALLGAYQYASPGAVGVDPAAQDVCVNRVHLAPQFVDLNGDGYLDVIALEREEPDSHELWVGELFGLWVAPEENSPLRSRAWLQEPTASGNGPRWVRAPRFDLPLRTPHPSAGRGGWAHSWVTMDWLNPQDCFYAEHCPPTTRNEDTGVRFADLNADSLTDAVWRDYEGIGANYSSQDEGVLINTGRGFDSTPASAWAMCATDAATGDLVGVLCNWSEQYLPPPGSGTASANIPVGHYADLNGDGPVDFLWLSTSIPSGFTVGAWLQSPGDPAGLWRRDDRFDPFLDSELLDFYPVGGTPAAFVVLDANGDGAADVIGDWRSRVSESHHPDLLRQVDNGRGGSFDLAYEAAALQREGMGLLETLAEANAAGHSETDIPDPNNPGQLLIDVTDVTRWTSRAVVSSVTVTSPNRPAATTSYHYARPRFDPEKRMGLGFRAVERWRPDGSIVKEFFRQRHGITGHRSRLEVWEDGFNILQAVEEWDAMAGATPDSHPEAYVGRRVSMESTNYFAGVEGAQRERQFFYDDDHGFNFVNLVVDQRPTGTLCTEFMPEDAANGFVRLVAERREYSDWNNNPANPACSGTLASEAIFTYASGRVTTRTDTVQRRGASDPPVFITKSFGYDSFGNVTTRTEGSALPDERTTEFCYDGDGDWCVDLSQSGQDSHSVLVGARQAFSNAGTPLTVVRSFTPDPNTGQVVKVESSFVDEPTVEFTLDPFGRVEETHLTPEGAGSSFVQAQTTYQDFASPPWREKRIYSDRQGLDYVSTAVVEDGFGGTWKTIEERPGGFFGTAVYRDPVAGKLYETLPVDCLTDGLCSALSGGEDNPAVPSVTTEFDALGRPVRIETPHGTAASPSVGVTLISYSGLGGLDGVLVQNAKGDFTRRLLDGNRVARVDECGDANCNTADQTLYAYEPTGEIASITDPEGNPLQFHYDTLGRVRRVDDPDGGMSTTDYNAFDEVWLTTNARGQPTSFSYDALGRLAAVDYPPGENDVTLTYRDDERQRATAGAWNYGQAFQYDDMGRLAQESLTMASKTFLLDFAYDELGRPTTITYPDDQTIVHYEYAGAYLDAVCEVPTATDDCAQASVFYLDAVVYDGLGRRQTVTTPAGTRTFTYDDATHRLTEDDFQGAGPDEYARSIDYQGYDELGNVVDVSASTSTAAVEFGGTYTYDARNRVASWTPTGGTQSFFTYDTLGNLTGHGVASPGDTNQTFGSSRPHAVTATAWGLTFTYDADGNLASRDAPAGMKYFGFDSQSRLVCKGDTPGSCEDYGATYDVGGRRIHDRVFQVDRFYLDELFTYEETDPGPTATVHIFAFGEEIARKIASPVTLRTAESWPWGLPAGLPPPLLAALLAGLACAGLVWALRQQLVVAEPATAALVAGLVTALALPPLPARSGGGGAVEGRHWLLGDPLGSAQVVFASDGAMKQETRFTPFGSVYQEAGAEVLNIYAGHPEVSSLRLFYMQARWYDPQTGTFLSVDPVVGDAFDPQSLNAYSYVTNNPISSTDPTGMCDWCWSFFSFFFGAAVPIPVQIGAVFGSPFPTLESMAQPYVVASTEPSIGNEDQSQSGGTQFADSGIVANDGSPIATELDPESRAAKILANEKLTTAANLALGKSHRMLGPGDGPLGTGFRPDGTLTQTHGWMAQGAERVTGSILRPQPARGLAGIGVALPRGYSVLSSSVIEGGFVASSNAFGVPVFTIQGPSGVLVTEQGFAPVYLPGGLR